MTDRYGHIADILPDYYGGGGRAVGCSGPVAARILVEEVDRAGHQSHRRRGWVLVVAAVALHLVPRGAGYRGSGTGRRMSIR